MPLLLALMRSSRGLLVSALLTSLVSGFGGALLVALMNEALSTGPAHMSALAGKFGALCVVVLICRWLSNAQFVKLSQNTSAELRARLSAHFADAPYRHIEQQGSARLMATLTEDVSTVSHFFVSLPELLMNAAVVIGCLAYLGTLSWKVFLFALGMVALGSLAYQFAEFRAIDALRTARNREDVLFGHFRALFDGAKELKLHRERRHTFIHRVLQGSIQEVRSARTRGLLIYGMAASVGAFLFFVLIGCVLFVLNDLFAVDSRTMSGYAMMFLYMMLPLEGVLGAIPNINGARVALERIDQCTPALNVPVAAAKGTRRTTFHELRLSGVTHRYRREDEDGAFMLGPIDLQLSAGELVFLIGGNGSGKTTLAKLVVGLYTPEAGQVLWNRMPLQAGELEDYQQLFSAVFSDFFLFESLMGQERPALDSKAREWLRALDLDRKVSIEGGVFSTTQLSQGQRKRLALLVACLEDRSVLVFDEWAADQDPSYRDVFYRRILPDLKASGKAVLVITHDDRYFDLADRCIKLEAGQIVPFNGTRPERIHSLAATAAV
jgi:putative pyoverdin transport system ATP-binding/permease protein